jgi:hypothetical protein
MICAYSLNKWGSLSLNSKLKRTNLMMSIVIKGGANDPVMTCRSILILTSVSEIGGFKLVFTAGGYLS